MPDEDELRGLIATIEDTFGRDIDGWLACFESPFVVLSAEATMVFGDHDTARERFAEMFDRLRAQGFASTAADAVRLRVLGDGLALVDASFTRRRADGTVLEQLGALYTCRRRAGEWKVATLLRHDHDVTAV